MKVCETENSRYTWAQHLFRFRFLQIPCTSRIDVVLNRTGRRILLNLKHAA